MKPRYLIPTVWALAWLVTYPALLADHQNSAGISRAIERQFCRKDAGTSAFMALLPPAWISTPFLTGFYENGFQFTCEGRRQEDSP